MELEQNAGDGCDARPWNVYQGRAQSLEDPRHGQNERHNPQGEHGHWECAQSKDFKGQDRIEKRKSGYGHMASNPSLDGQACKIFR